MTTFESDFRVRSYELDSFGHANYAVYLNWFEEARWEALREGGVPVDELEERGWAIYVVRAEVDYLEEARLGDRLTIRTRVERYRNSSMTIGQEAVRADAPDRVVARSRVVAVWIDTGTGRPTRIPAEVREGLGEPAEAAPTPGSTPASGLATLLLAGAAVLGLAACGNGDAAPDARGGLASEMARACAPDDGGIELPEGFCALVVAEELGRARHLDVASNGDVFVAVPGSRGGGGGGVVALRDTTGDGRADVEERWGDGGGNEVLLHDGFLWFSTDEAVLRYPLPEGSLRPSGPPDTLVSGLPVGGHRSKSLAIGSDGALYVNHGSRSNACQEEPRTEGSPGLDPCPELEVRAGIWRFDADRTGQTPEDGVRFATGLRNTVALRMHPETGVLYGVVHGRDQLHQLWPDLFTVEQSAELPAEELVRIEEGDDFGWPYCYHDQIAGRKVLAPEYGGEGGEVGRCAGAKDPLIGFPGHWAPNDLEFYAADQFPERYHGGAFIAFHGSWNRAPLPQEGYRVTFVPWADGGPAGKYETFADGFRDGEGAGPGEASYRPVGVAVGPDGSLYVSDSVRGRIWRVVYAGGAAGVGGG